MRTLKRYDWPGNVRELQNVIERAVILSPGEQLRLDTAFAGRRSAEGNQPANGERGAPDEVVPEQEWRRRERANLLAALKRAGGRIYGSAGAAELLGVKPSTLQSRLKALGIRTHDVLEATGGTTGD